MDVDGWNAAHVRAELRGAVQELTSRGLKQSAMWAAEMLAGLGSGATTGPATEASFPMPAADTDRTLLAGTYFSLGEYLRCAHALSPNGGLPEGGDNKEIFLWGYSTYLAGERRKEEEMCEVTDPLERSQLVNGNLKLLRNVLTAYIASSAADGFVLYLFGVVLKEMDSPEAARQVLCEAVSAFPLNWSAWVDLAALCTEQETVASLEGSLPSHWTADFFRGHVLLELQQNEEAVALYTQQGMGALSSRFPTSTFVLAQTAMAHYNLRNFDEAQELFESLAERDPHRLQNMDTYSNILYVKECKAELSYLAHSAVRSGKHRPETCCIIGNYYSLKAQHERAVLYFRRALRLNRRYLSAWTLMGHEYVELKNTPAAVEAYRRAVDLNPRDYRAWYGLGQTYEILQMYFYALHYYRKATTLRPYDARMWCALAGCYEQLERIKEAIKCYRRAECHKDREGIAAQKRVTQSSVFLSPSLRSPDALRETPAQRSTPRLPQASEALC